MGWWGNLLPYQAILEGACSRKQANQNVSGIDAHKYS